MSLEDQLVRLLDHAPAGMTVERLRSLLQAGGARAGKDEIVLALRNLSKRGLTQIGVARKWQLREQRSGLLKGRPAHTPAAGSTGWLAAIPCAALSGDKPEPEMMLPSGRLVPDRNLFGRLLPYYQEALRAGDGGSPFDVVARHNESFVLLQPDRPWWPTRGQEQNLRLPLARLPPAFQSVLAKNSGKKLLLGYPIHTIVPRNSESQPFLRPVSTFRCRFSVTETHLDLIVPATPPAIVQDWLRDQKKYGGWDVSRLKSWLLLEDEHVGFGDDDDIGSSDFLEIPDFATRLGTAAGRDLHQSLTPSAIAAGIPSLPATGYYNALILMPDAGGRYTRSAIADYDSLQARPTDSISSTALDPFFGGPQHAGPAAPVLHSFPLAESQLLAARAALAGPLTVITGPPGTGKSQTIAAMVLTAAAAGKSVLFAARQHRALDAVQERLHEVTKDRVLMVRANDPEGVGAFSFSDALKALQARAGNSRAAEMFARNYQRLQDLDSRRWARLDQWRQVKHETEAAAELASRIEALERKLSELPLAGTLRAHSPYAGSRGIARISNWIRHLLSWRSQGIPIGDAWVRNRTANEILNLKTDLRLKEERVATLRATVANTSDDPVQLSDQLVKETKIAIENLLDQFDAVSPEDRQVLTDIVGEANLLGAGRLPVEACRLILRHFPVWAVTTLAAGSRIPLEPGLFDYVIFDEAAQTDIASALPLLYRARTGVIVGDPMQLAMISNLDPNEERDLLRRHHLLVKGIGRYAHGRTTLFDLASVCSGESRYMLTDHYRCHPQIAAYFNEAFYGRRLTALTDVSRLKVPRGFSPGLHWTCVVGPIASRTGRQSGSAASQAEASAIVEHLKTLVDQGFEGTIGVVSFFEFQAQTINELAARAIGSDKLNKHAVKVFTTNKFQGDERDVMLLSLCLGSSTPIGARRFIEKERRLLNVAISRARAVCHIFGDLTYARGCGIPHIETLVKKVLQARDHPHASADDRFESPWERRLYDALVERGLSPIPQHPVGGRYLDLALIDETGDRPRRIDIEVDGVAFHTDVDGRRLPTDLWRDHQLRGLGWKVLRFWVYELRDDMERCLERIESELRA